MHTLTNVNSNIRTHIHTHTNTHTHTATHADTYKHAHAHKQCWGLAGPKLAVCHLSSPSHKQQNEPEAWENEVWAGRHVFRIKAAKRLLFTAQT